MTGQRRIAVDREKCVGAGQCIIRAAGQFDLDEQGYVVVLASPSITPGTDPDVDEAVAGCPSGALSWERASAHAGQEG